MVIINLRLKLAVGGAAEWKTYIRRTDFRITGLSLYLITYIFVLILKEVMSLWAETSYFQVNGFVCNVSVPWIVNN